MKSSAFYELYSEIAQIFSVGYFEEQIFSFSQLGNKAFCSSGVRLKSRQKIYF